LLSKHFLLNKIFNKNFFLVFANFAQKFFTFSAFAFVSKNLTTKEYGNYVYLLLIIGIVLELVNAGLFQGIQNDISKKIYLQDECKISINKSYTSIIILSVICFLIVFFMYILNSRSLQNENYNIKFILFTFFIFILTSSLNSLGNIVFIATQQFKLFLISILTQGISLLFLLAILFYNKLQSSIIILFVFAISYFIANVFHLYKIKPKLIFDYNSFFSVFNKGKWYILWSIISVLESRTDMYLLSRKLSLTSLAIFDIATKYLIIGQILTTILSQKYLPQLLANNDRSIIEQKLKKVSLISVPFLILLIFPVGLFINIFYNGKYNDSILCYIIMTVALIFNLLNINNTSKLISNNLEKYLFFISFICFCIKIPISVILIENLDSIGAAIATSFAQITAFILFFIFVKRLTFGK
jgi:O-antigen/teichoic acid export membrane protein